MVTIFQKGIEAYRSFINYKRCKHAIEEADRRKVQTGRKQFVIMYNGRPLVISKWQLQKKIRLGFFQKGFTILKAESMAIYKTL